MLKKHDLRTQEMREKAAEAVEAETRKSAKRWRGLHLKHRSLGIKMILYLSRGNREIYIYIFIHTRM